ncbi:flagellar biosynthesis protein FlhF [Planococcus plakortidis]|uniref:flagellar biosynthesis protein FlhF n=1 Tax=Planococcus plakortidis TaxID=1038856 RepID=UPI003984F3D7
MRLKTYRVTTMPEAMALIKRDLGDDALILNTKKVKTGGLFGLFRKDCLEVTAAAETAEQSALKAVAPAKAQPAPAEAPATKGQENDALMEELQSLKRLMMHEGPEDRLPEPLRPLRSLLEKQGVEQTVQTELLSKLLKASENEAPVQEAFHAELIRFIEQHQQAIKNESPSIACFIGPTGVGKTTTIAKVAAEQLLEHKRTVGLITADTYRIAAVAQLKTYGEILDVPVEVVESREQLAGALDALKDCDVILIDTAGRNYQQAEYIQDLQRLLPETQHIHTTLVLSLTAKYEDMVQIIGNFEALSIDELLLTKKDETASAGVILNLLHRYRIPLRRIATGQNVPDDLVAATPGRIADYIAGELRHA